jgi:hypothetical protein
MAFSFLEGSGAKQFEVPGAQSDLAFRMAAPKKLYTIDRNLRWLPKLACLAPVKAAKSR